MAAPPHPRANPPSTAAPRRPALERTAMVKEAMRLDPPAYALGRLSLTDHEVGGYLIPAGSFVAVSQFATHRHPHIWEDPEAFDPGITLRPDVAVPIQPARR